MGGHDFGLDVIVTPDRVIQCDRSTRPGGDPLGRAHAEKIAAIPLLAPLAASQA